MSDELLREAKVAAVYWESLWASRSVAIAQKSFRFPSGKEPTDQQVNDTMEQWEKAKQLIARINSALESGGWMPIETAPKDGSRFLGYRKRDDVYGDCYRVQRDDCEMWCFRGTSGSHALFPFIRPDSWQPLQPLPTKEAGK